MQRKRSLGMHPVARTSGIWASRSLASIWLNDVRKPCSTQGKHKTHTQPQRAGQHTRSYNKP